MKTFYKYFGIIGIMLFSFYYTEKIALFMREKDPIYMSIEDVSKENNVDYVNAEINDDTIIPGINGLTVNTEKSFQKMKSFGAFNKYYLIFDQVRPEVSLEDNKEKIIIEGNSQKKSVAIVLSDNKTVEDYFISNQIKASLLIKKDTFKRESYFEQINNDSRYFKDTESLLESIKQNKNICIINNYNKEMCTKEKKYLVKPSLTLTSSNLASIKGKVKNGSIIQIDSSAKLDDVKLLLNQISYKGLTVIPLSELILEDNTIKIQE